MHTCITVCIHGYVCGCVCTFSQNCPHSAANEPRKQYCEANLYGNRQTLQLVNRVPMISELDVCVPPSQSHIFSVAVAVCVCQKTQEEGHKGIMCICEEEMQRQRGTECVNSWRKMKIEEINPEFTHVCTKYKHAWLKGQQQ